jgi:hypothetical protein
LNFSDGLFPIVTNFGLSVVTEFGLAIVAYPRIFGIIPEVRNLMDIAS